jgi:hypothetical protein
MTNANKSESISRRKAILLLGLGAAFTLADSPEELSALAQEAAPAAGGAAATPATGGTKGMQRRKSRRATRHHRRAARRGTAPAATAPAK